MKKSLIIFLTIAISISNLIILSPTAYSKDDKGITISNHAKENRIALVIGNSDYKKISGLTNTVNDAKEMSKTLKNLGFKVIEKINVNREEMMSAIDNFREELVSKKGVGLFYYSGHGIQVNGENYLVPTDADIKSESQVSFRAVNAGEVLSAMYDAKSNVNIVILDACRDNPFKSFSRSSNSKGLASMNAPKGTIVAYATSPGSVASDGGNKKNGLYTSKLLKYLKVKNLKIEEIFKKVRNEMDNETRGAQIPWESSSLTGDFYFSGTNNNMASIPSKNETIESVNENVTEQSKEIDKYDQMLEEINKKEAEKQAKVKNIEKVYNKLVTLDKSEQITKDQKAKIWEEFLNDYANTDNPYKTDVQNKIAKYTFNWENGVFVEGGSFDMGDNKWDYTKPIHKVTISSFYISKYETTQAEYQSLMGSNPSNFKGSNLPVEKVSWYDAIKYCNAKSKKEGLSVAYNETTGDLLDSSGNATNDITKVKGYRLPTDAEWEYAARGGNKSQGYTYSGGNNAEEVAVYEENSYKKGSSSSDYGTHIVGSKKPNELGIYDMSGNVWEWCTDYWSDNYNNSTTINPVNTKSSGSRVDRGGSWRDYAVYLRVGDRRGYTPTSTDDYLGFRLARTY